MTDSVLTFPAYAVRAVPWFPAKGGNNVAMGPSVSYSITVRLEVASRGRAVSGITRAVEQAGGVVTALDVTAGRGSLPARHAPRPLGTNDPEVARPGGGPVRRVPW